MALVTVVLCRLSQNQLFGRSDHSFCFNIFLPYRPRDRINTYFTTAQRPAGPCAVPTSGRAEASASAANRLLSCSRKSPSLFCLPARDLVATACPACAAEAQPWSDSEYDDGGILYPGENTGSRNIIAAKSG